MARSKKSISHVFHFCNPRILGVVIVISLSFFITHRAEAQANGVKVVLHSPPPFQMNVEMLWSVDLINNGSEREVRLYGVATETQTGRWIANGLSNKFTIPSGFTSVKPSDISPIDYDADPQYDEIVTRTGKVPSGDYTICMYVLDAKTNDTLGRDCINQHVVLNVTPPQLIHPSNSTVLLEKLPVFSWTPISPLAPVTDVSYDLRIVELVGRQTPFDAIQSNPPWFEEEELPTPLCPYPLSAQSFEMEVSYAWQVLAYARSASGDRIELCRSEIWSFSLGTIITNKDTVLTDSIDIIDNDSNITKSVSDGKNTQIITDKNSDTPPVLATVVSIPIIAATDPKTEICKTLRAKLSETGQQRIYKFTISTSDTDTSGVKNPEHTDKPDSEPPTGIRIRINGDSILAIEGGPTIGWKRTPAKLTSKSSSIKWVNTTGAIPSGEINLGLLKFSATSPTQSTLVYEWLNKDDVVICKDSTTLSESISYYELSDEFSDVFIEVPNDVLHVQYSNNYGSGNLAINIFDIESQSLLESKMNKGTGANSMNGLNRITVPLNDYKLAPGKNYILNISDSKNNYQLNFKLTTDKATNDREK